MRIAIDTNILVNAFKNHEPVHNAVASLIVLRKARLCHDTASKIVEEYERNLGNVDSYRKWYNTITELNAIDFCKGRLPKQHCEQLSEFGCHEPSDHVFIAVAFYSDKHLISEDSDVGKGPKGNQPPHCDALRYLNGTMGITVYDAQEACRYLGNKP